MRNFLIILVLILLSGCGYSASVKNELEAQLMPELVAKNILAKYFDYRWVNNPVGYYTQGFGKFCGNNGWDALPFDEINDMRVVGGFGDEKRILLNKFNWLLVGVPCQLMAYEIVGVFSEQDINDIVDALVSLGAKIKKVSQK